MSTDLRYLRPSQTKKIASRLEAGEGASEVLSALKVFLQRYSEDSGHARDVLFSTAKELSAAGVWRYLDNHAVALSFANDIRPNVALCFLSGLPKDRRDAIKHAMASIGAEKANSGDVGSAADWLWKTAPPKAKQRLSSNCVRLFLPAGTANPHSPSALKLSRLDISAAEFCQAFNNHTANTSRGSPVAVIVCKDDQRVSFVVLASRADAMAAANKLARKTPPRRRQKFTLHAGELTDQSRGSLAPNGASEANLRQGLAIRAG